MALFSRRFWNSLIKLDGRVANAVAKYDSAVKRLLTSRVALSKEARVEFHLEACEAITELRGALNDLREFLDRNST